MDILITSALLSLIVGLLYYFVSRKAALHSCPPGPRGWDLVRANLVSMSGSLPLHLEEWSREYGDVVFCPLLMGNMLFLNTPSATKELFAGKSTEKFANDRMWSYVADLMCHKKCLTFSPASAPYWAKMRKMMHSSLRFYGEGIAEFEELAAELLHRTMTSLESHRGQDILMKNVVEDFVTCMMAVLLTGEVYEADSELCRAIRRFNDSVMRIADPLYGTLMSTFPFLGYIPGTRFSFNRQELLASKKAVLDMLLKDRQGTRKRVGIVDKLLEQQSNEGGDWMTDDHVKGFLMDIMAGGILTSTHTINTLLFHLLHRPDAARRIQEELDRVAGPEPRRAPALSDRPLCHYTEAFVLESMRSAPLLPLGLDHLITQDVQFRGWHIPKGTVAFTGAYAYNQSPALWTEPQSFTPERFLDEEGHLVPPNHPSRQSLLSFGTGKRICAGEKFARARIFLFVSWLLGSFDILPPRTEPLLPNDERAWTQGLVSCFNLKPYHCCLSRREN